MSNLEQLFGATLRGPAGLVAPGSGAKLFGGRTTFYAGSTHVVVSAAVISSDQVVLLGTEVTSVGVVANSGDPTVVVNSVVDGKSFAFARRDGSVVDRDETVTWLLFTTS